MKRMASKNRFAMVLFICLAVCAVLFAAFIFSACNDSEVDGDGNNSNDKVYSVSYERGADDAVGELPAVTSFVNGAKITLAAADTFSRSGYTFDKWSYGDKTYSAGEEFTMPASDITFTAVWKKIQTENPPTEDDDKPTLVELDNKFYVPSNWEYMTNNAGESLDGGDIVYALSDGSVKFHRVNQAINIGKITAASFMLKATDDWTVWFNSSSKDNHANSTSYRLQATTGEIKLIVHDGTDILAAVVKGSTYAKGEWNRFDIEFTTENSVCKIKLYINEQRAQLVAGDAANGIKIENNCVIHTQPTGFGGDYTCVKVWEAHKYVQIKPVANKSTADVKIIAAIGASITAGANADNFYTESYPAQLQNALGGSYNVVNFGNSGKTVNPEPGDGAPWMEQDQWRGVQAIKPDVIIVNIGTNDSKPDNFLGKDGFKTAYTNFINAIKVVNPDMDVYICTVPYAYSNSYSISNDNIRDTIAVVQREVAEENEYHLIDLYEITQNKSLIFDDGIHPHSIGYGMFAEIIKKMIVDGDDAITAEYLQTIDAKYNDKVTNFNAEITTANNELKLIVSGDTTLPETANIKVQLRVNNDDYSDYNATISGGKFNAKIDLAQIESAYYNVRVYVYDETYYPVENSFYHLMLMSETDGYAAGNAFHTNNKQVKLASWNSGWGATFSISSISDYHYLELTSATLVEDNDKIMLTISGTTGESGLRLGLVDGNEHDYYKDITVGGDGTFTATYDLATLSADGGWYNARIFFADDTYFTVKYTDVKKSDGTTALTTSDIFYGVNDANPAGSKGVKVSIKTWGNENPLSMAVEYFDNTYSVTATEVKLQNGKLVFSGTTRNVENLAVYLYNKVDDYYGVDNVTIESDGSFIVEIGLEQLSAGNGNWYRIKYSVGDGELENLNVFNGFDQSATYDYKMRQYYFATGGDVAVVYRARTLKYSITSATISEVDGKATLNIVGTLDSDIAAADVALLLDKTSDTKQQLTVQNSATSAGAFSFTYDISALLRSTKIEHSQEEGYFMRLVVYGTNVNISSEKVKDQLFEEVEIGNHTYYFYRNSLTAYNTLGIVRIDSSLLDTTPVVTAGAVKFDGDSFVFSGTAKNVTTLYVYLINTNISSSLDNYVTAVITADGKFTATFALDDLIALNATQVLNLRYKLNDLSVGTTNVERGAMDITQVYAYGGKTFTMSINGSCVAVKYKATTPEVIANYVGFEDACLVVRATAVGVTSIRFIINNTVINFAYNVDEVTLDADGTFELKISLDEFGSATSGNNLNLRVYIDGATSTTNITQGQTDISQTCTYNGRNYKFAMNGGCVSFKY